MTTHENPSLITDTSPDLIAAFIIGFYLVLEVTFLSYIAVMFWLASDLSQLLNLPMHPPGFELFRSTLSQEKFLLFRKLTLAACSAGIGGSVFMIRGFYINFAYGSLNDKGCRTYLKNREIPRYLMLPFSAIVLGPISIFLLQAGAIIFAGVSSEKDIPDYTIMAVSFVFGFSYHDSLKALHNLSRKMYGVKKE